MHTLLDARIAAAIATCVKQSPRGVPLDDIAAYLEAHDGAALARHGIYSRAAILTAIVRVHAQTKLPGWTHLQRYYVVER